MSSSRPGSPPAVTAAADFPQNDAPPLKPADGQPGGSHTVLLYTNEQQGALVDIPPPQAPSSGLSRLEKLPAGLRHMVYTHLFGDGGAEPRIKVTVDSSNKCLRVPEFATMHALCLTNRQLSSEVQAFIFRFCNFFLHNTHTSCLIQLKAFASYIGPSNVARIRKLTISFSSIGATADHHCVDGLFRLRTVVIALRKFSALVHVDIDVEAMDHMPSHHASICTQTGIRPRIWKWIGISEDHPMRECFKALQHSGRIGRVDVGDCWTEFLASEHLSVGSMALYETFKTDYRALLLVTLGDWLGTLSRRGVESLE
jgi:hypothetical protein